MAARAYVETSIPNFYFEARSEPQMVARREWTREWWGRATSTGTELVTSVAVIDELERGEFAARPDCLALVASLPILAIEDAILEIVPTRQGTLCTLPWLPITVASFS